MELTEEDINKKCEGHCGRNMLFPYEYEWTGVSCGHNVIKRKHELTEIKRKKVNFINRLKYSEHKKVFVCIEVYKIYEGDDFGKIYEVFSTFKIKIIKINNILVDKYKDMIENQGFEQDYWSRTAEGVNKIGLDSNRFVKWLAYFDRSYHENINYYDVMGSS